MRPISYLSFHYWSFIGRSFLPVLVTLFICSSFTVFIVGSLPINFQSIIGGIVLLILGYTLDFFISALIGLSTFLLGDILVLRWTFQKCIIFLGGMILPFSIFPSSFQQVLTYLPFGLIYNASARLIVHYNIFDLCRKYYGV